LRRRRGARRWPRRFIHRRTWRAMAGKWCANSWGPERVVLKARRTPKLQRLRGNPTRMWPKPAGRPGGFFGSRQVVPAAQMKVPGRCKLPTLGLEGFTWPSQFEKPFCFQKCSGRLPERMPCLASRPLLSTAHLTITWDRSYPALATRFYKNGRNDNCELVCGILLELAAAFFGEPSRSIRGAADRLSVLFESQLEEAGRDCFARNIFGKKHSRCRPGEDHGGFEFLMMCRPLGPRPKV